MPRQQRSRRTGAHCPQVRVDGGGPIPCGTEIARGAENDRGFELGATERRVTQRGADVAWTRGLAHRGKLDNTPDVIKFANTLEESVIGTVFEASFSIDDRHPTSVLPHITGTAYVSAEATLIFDNADPLRWGIKNSG